MKKFKIFALLISIFVLLILLGGCFEQSKVFEKDGIKITATSAFYEKDLLTLTIYLESTDKLITALKETPSTDFPISKTLRQYSEIVLLVNNLIGTQIDNYNEGGVVFDYFTYERSESGKNFKYLAITKKSSSYFYLFNFACEVKNYDKFADTFFEWAKLIEVE